MADELRTGWTAGEHVPGPDSSAPQPVPPGGPLPECGPLPAGGPVPQSSVPQPDSSSDRLAQAGIFRHGYGLIPKYAMQDRELSITAKAIYAYLCSLCGGGETAFPGVETIRAALGLGKDAYYQHRRQLEEAGYITVQRRHRGKTFTSNLYTLNANPKRFQRDAVGPWENRVFAAVQFHGLRGAGYGVLPRTVMTDSRLDAKAKALYAYFASFTGAGTCAFPSLERMLWDLGVSQPAYYKYLNQLKKTGYLATVQRRNGTRFAVNEYYLLDGTEREGIPETAARPDRLSPSAEAAGQSAKPVPDGMPSAKPEAGRENTQSLSETAASPSSARTAKAPKAKQAAGAEAPLKGRQTGGRTTGRVSTADPPADRPAEKSPFAKNPDIMEPFAKKPDIIKPDTMEPDIINPDTTINTSLASNKIYTNNKFFAIHPSIPPLNQPGTTEPVETNRGQIDRREREKERESQQALGEPSRIYAAESHQIRDNFHSRKTDPKPGEMPPEQTAQQDTAAEGTNGQIKEPAAEGTVQHTKGTTAEETAQRMKGAAAEEMDRRIEDREAFMRELRQACGYENMRFSHADMQLIDSLISLMAATVCDGNGPMVRIGRQKTARAEARRRFLSLTEDHILYVLECVRQHIDKIQNPRAYYLTALWNAPGSMELYDQSIRWKGRQETTEPSEDAEGEGYSGLDWDAMDEEEKKARIEALWEAAFERRH